MPHRGLSQGPEIASPEGPRALARVSQWHHGMRTRLYIWGVALLAALGALGAVFVLAATPPDQNGAAPPPIEEEGAEAATVATALPEEKLDEGAPLKRSPDRSNGAPEAIRLRAPRAAQLKLDLNRPVLDESSQVALALYFRTSLFAGPAKTLDVVGFARRGARIPVKKRVTGAGCKGRWYLVRGVAPSGPQTWQSLGGSPESLRDAEIDAAAASCP